MPAGNLSNEDATGPLDAIIRNHLQEVVIMSITRIRRASSRLHTCHVPAMRALLNWCAREGLLGKQCPTFTLTTALYSPHATHTGGLTECVHQYCPLHLIHHHLSQSGFGPSTDAFLPAYTHPSIAHNLQKSRASGSAQSLRNGWKYSHKYPLGRSMTQTRTLHSPRVTTRPVSSALALNAVW